ncbi:heme ABC exporter ATP-binding protein CcmA [Roseateles sp.]|uniref:heme ABC exporter ATP-binding protein CcmA n=1 Tax=Roseateles sp. TaxID=1971397 RepID=UPI0031DC0356
MPTVPPSAEALRIERLGCVRGGRWLFRDLSLELRAGRALALRGANGSGKSSLLRAIAGLLPIKTGVIDRPSGFAYLAHQNGLNLDLTVEENLVFARRIAGFDDGAGSGRSQAPRIRTISDALDAVGLRNFAPLQVRRLSQGQRRRVALARVAMSGQSLWLLDEPTAALDTGGEARFHTLLDAHLSSGGLAVVATHHPLALPLERLIDLDLDAHRAHARHADALPA